MSALEKQACPGSAVEAATAVPAFIGHTERADHCGKSLRNVAWRIGSMAEYRQCFGGPPHWKFELRDAGEAPALFTQGGRRYALAKAGDFMLYLSLLLFFQNGGGPCYVVSVGDYSSPVARGPLEDGLVPLAAEREPTMVLVPEAVLLEPAACHGLQQAMLRHCGEMRNRIAILDVPNGWRDIRDPAGDCIADFRAGVGTRGLDFGAAYYPWLNTALVQDAELSFENLADRGQLAAVLRRAMDEDEGQPADERGLAMQALFYRMAGTPAGGAATRHELHSRLSVASPLYKAILQEARRQLNLVPPSAAMAGLYTVVDNTRGVWRAPANLSLNGVVSPAVNLSAAEQEDLNLTPHGKPINTIRSFIGEGVRVWGARTLDGNGPEGGCVNVRRALIMLEASCRLAAEAMAWEPHVPATWDAVKRLIEGFLAGVWQRGGLAGASPDEAFGVQVGPGDGGLRVTVRAAVGRPADFAEIRFEQRMHGSWRS